MTGDEISSRTNTNIERSPIGAESNLTAESGIRLTSPGEERRLDQKEGVLFTALPSAQPALIEAAAEEASLTEPVPGRPIASAVQTEQEKISILKLFDPRPRINLTQAWNELVNRRGAGMMSAESVSPGAQSNSLAAIEIKEKPGNQGGTGLVGAPVDPRIERHIGGLPPLVRNAVETVAQYGLLLEISPKVKRMIEKGLGSAERILEVAIVEAASGLVEERGVNG